MTNEEFRELLGPGAHVRTRAKIDPHDERGYVADAVRRPDSAGIVLRVHDSHGVCFAVEHEDGIVGYYDIDELILTNPLRDAPSHPPIPGETGERGVTTMARSEQLQALLDKYGIETCRDNSCMFGSPGGMGTNGGCRCVERAEMSRTSTPVRMLVQKLAMALREATGDLSAQPPAASRMRVP